MRTVALVLAANSADSKVIVDGLDVSDMCTGVEIEAHVGTPTAITLFLIANCELFAEVPDVATVPPEAQP